MLYLTMHLVSRIWTQIANALAWQDGPTDRAAQLMQSNGSRDLVHIDDSMAGAWIRQQRRLKEAIAQAKQRNAPTMPADLDDEWVDPWIRQQRRLKGAILRAKRQHLAAKG